MTFDIKIWRLTQKFFFLSFIHLFLTFSPNLSVIGNFREKLWIKIEF